MSAMLRGGATKSWPSNEAVTFFASSIDTAGGWQPARQRIGISSMAAATSPAPRVTALARARIGRG